MTIPVDTSAPELASTDVSAVITAPQPIIVERAMYLSRPGQPFAAGPRERGRDDAGARVVPGRGRHRTVLRSLPAVANPDATAAQVTVDYLLPAAERVAKIYGVPANGRVTVWVDDEQIPRDPGSGRWTTSPCRAVASTNGVPIIVERAMWWPSPALGRGPQLAGRHCDRHAMGRWRRVRSAGRAAPRPTC